MKTAEGVSTAVPAGQVLASLLLFTVVYGALMVADLYLLVKNAKGEVMAEKDPVGRKVVVRAGGAR
jgi:cytochrome bd-type quinol oxidase subunit 1